MSIDGISSVETSRSNVSAKPTPPPVRGEDNRRPIEEPSKPVRAEESSAEPKRRLDVAA
jgi:hypothetical protein